MILWLLLAVAGFAVARYFHVQMYPYKACPRCKGSRRNASGFAHRDCTRCGAKGRVLRWGASEVRR